MPVVSPSLQFPSDWLKASTSIGVIRDGQQLRFWFSSGEGNSEVVSVEEWTSESSSVRKKVLAQVEQGAWVIAGLSPDRGWVRELVSPFGDETKSAEIWPSLLDAALPFPIEECAVSFLPPTPRPEGGISCIAAAARSTDIDDALEEWSELGLVPDLLIPEIFLLSEPKSSRVWHGENRSLYTAWHDGQFLGAGGGKPSSFNRFRNVWSADHPGMTWEETGPKVGEKPNLLEQRAADAVLQQSGLSANVLIGSSSSRLQQSLRRKHRNLLVKGTLILILLFLGPILVRAQLRASQHQLQDRIVAEYLRLTGEPRPDSAQGQEVLLAERYLEDALQDITRARKEVSGPQLTRRLQRVMLNLASRKLVITRLEAEPFRVVAEILAEEGDVRSLQLELEKYGDEISITPAEQGTWRVEVSDL